MRTLLLALVVMAMTVSLGMGAQAGEIQVVRRIYFTIDQAEILPASRQVLHEVAVMLRANPNQRLSLAGHTCDLESNEYNETLARQRADNALAYLINVEGIARDRVIESSAGEEQPRYLNLDENSRALNRRVVLTMNVLAAPDPLPARTVNSMIIDGNNAFLSGGYTYAVLCYRNALALEPENLYALNNLGAAYYQLGDYYQSGYYYDALLRRSPTSPQAYLYLGICLNQQGYRERAVQSWQYCLQLDPHNVTARQLLSQYWL